MKSTMPDRLIIWDSSGDPLGQGGEVLCWRSYTERSAVSSVPRYLEDHAEDIRKKYLAFIHDLGESRIGGKRVIDHLSLECGISYWWMTLLVEKSPYKSSMADTLHLFALEEIVKDRKPRKLCLVSSNRDLNEAISELCRALNIAYEWTAQSTSAPKATLKTFYEALPYSLQALASLMRRAFIYLPFRKRKDAGWFSGDGALFLCSYFDNVDARAAESGRFHSYYWGNLRELLANLGYRSNWLELFIPCKTSPTPRAAIDLAERFNLRSQDQDLHVFLAAYFNWRIVVRVLRGWAKLLFINWRLKTIRRVFRPKDSSLSLWPVMRRNWYASMLGSTATDNLLWIELFEQALRDLPSHRKGLYLCEGHAWERAFIHAWRKHGHGQLIAVPHSTVPFWDLSYFTDARTLGSRDSHPIPQPDIVALNGKVAIDAFLRAGYPKEGIVECEALRYEYLKDARVRHGSPRTEKGQIDILIVGDYQSTNTVRMLQILELALPHFVGRMAFTMKPHPNCPVNPEDYPSLQLAIITDSLGEILQNYDAVFAGSTTSAALDAYLAGLQLVVMLDESELNLSPLRGQSGVCFVSTPEELAPALEVMHQDVAERPDVNDFFFLDPNLSRWARLLAS